MDDKLLRLLLLLFRRVLLFRRARRCVCGVELLFALMTTLWLWVVYWRRWLCVVLLLLLLLLD